MDLKTFNIIRRVARDVRQWAEKERIKLGFSEELAGMCAIASAKIMEALRSFGIKSKIVYSDSESYGDHCFVVVEDYLVDVTATQFEYFDHNEVEIFKITKEVVGFRRFWRGSKSFHNVSDLRDFQVKNDWPVEQTVNV